MTATQTTNQAAKRWPLISILVLTAALSLINLGINGWGNPYYAAATWAGTQDWRAFFFGAFDPANAITVDKPPLSLWLMGFSARLFGFNAFALLLPQLLCSLAAVFLLYRAVRPQFGARAANLSALVLALTPVWVAVFRFDDPDSLLVTLVLGAVVATLALNRSGHTRWALLVGALLGFAFMTKYLQAFLVLPVLGLGYLLFGRPKIAWRLLHLLLALIGLVVAGSWWVAIVSATPVAQRPYLGGSSDNTLWNLILGYNGFGRIAGGAGNATGSQTGISTLQPGLFRLFGTDVGGHIAWLIPLALIVAITGVMLFWRTRKADTRFFEIIMWGGGLLSTAVTLSVMNGVFHEYYTVALVPFIAALTGIGVHLARENWQRPWMRYLTTATILVSAILACWLLNKSPDVAWLGWVVLLTGIAGVFLMLTKYGAGRNRTLSTLLTITLLGGQIVYDFYTVTTPQLASIPVAGPIVVFPFTGGTGMGPLKYVPVNPKPAVRTIAGDRDLWYSLLKKEPTDTWVVAQTSGLSAANTELATRLPVLLLGGYTAKDPYPTLAQFKKFVAEKKVGYYYLTGEPKILDDGNVTEAERIEIWVAENYAPVRVGTGYLYNLNP